MQEEDTTTEASRPVIVVRGYRCTFDSWEARRTPPPDIGTIIDMDSKPDAREYDSLRRLLATVGRRIEWEESYVDDDGEERDLWEVVDSE